jgi:predicted XRE-type DNA-binding protein
MIEIGTENVYADLAYADPDTMLIKAQLVTKLGESISARGLTETEAAALLDWSPVEVSATLRGQFRSVSEARLLAALARLGRNIRIVIGPPTSAPCGAGRVELDFA